MTHNRFPVGIDLGTTFSSISYVDQQGRVETIRLEDGKFAMASAVYFQSEDEILVGNEALDFALIDAPRVARAFKRNMGEADWCFEVDGKAYRPEELSAMVLKKLIAEASQKIGPIEEVVISVPFMFDEGSRRATKNAGRIAGVEVLDIVDEPVAAAIAYGHTLMKGGGFYGDAQLDELFSDGRILVYDLGGGTFDLTLLQLETDYSFTVKATDGDSGLGGEDWDAELADHLQQEYRSRFRANPQAEPEVLQELRSKAEEAKKTLSERPVANVELARGDKTEVVTIRRGDFERMTAHLIDRTLTTLESMLNRVDMTYSYVDFVLLIGGSSRMPMVSKMLERETKRQLDMSLSPDTAVSQGAALFAAYRMGDSSMRNVDIKTVNPHALGLLTRSKKQKKQVNDVLIQSNMRTETEVTRTYPIIQGAKSVSLVVLQGELPDPEDCIPLGRVAIPDVSPDLLAGAKLVVTFSFNQNGLLEVRGMLHPADEREPLQVNFEVEVEGSMSEDEVEDAIATLAGITID
jgi:molecular chaperone DnaK